MRTWISRCPSSAATLRICRSGSAGDPAATGWCWTRASCIIDRYSPSMHSSATPATFSPVRASPIFGQALRISFPRASSASRAALAGCQRQWLPPELTAGKETAPSWFTRSRAIPCPFLGSDPGHARVALGYSAASAPPGLLARMSANNNPLDAASGDYRFSSCGGIPSCCWPWPWASSSSLPWAGAATCIDKSRIRSGQIGSTASKTASSAAAAACHDMERQRPGSDQGWKRVSGRSASAGAWIAGAVIRMTV